MYDEESVKKQMHMCCVYACMYTLYTLHCEYSSFGKRWKRFLCIYQKT